MGGMFIVLLLLERPEIRKLVKGAILSAPSLVLTNLPGPVETFFGRLASCVVNFTVHNRVDEGLISRNKAYLEQRAKDPLCQHVITIRMARMFVDSVALAGELLSDKANVPPDMPPILAVFGRDDSLTPYKPANNSFID